MKIKIRNIKREKHEHIFTFLHTKKHTDIIIQNETRT